MAIKIECPRCQAFMTLSAEEGGQYTACSNCGGKVWVPKQAVRAKEPAAVHATPVQQKVQGRATVTAQPIVSQSASEAVLAQSSPVQSPATQVRQSEGTSVPSAVAHLTQTVPPTQATVMPQATVPQQAAPHTMAGLSSSSQPQRRVAKFITADVANSSLAVATDGALPELQLDQAETRKKREPSEKQGTRPWLLALVLCASLSASVLLLLMPSAGTPSGNTRVEQARERLQAYYVPVDGTLQPYQIYLRQAHLAHSRGDSKAEEASYRKVLALLRDESLLRPDGSPRSQKGLTGSRLKSENEQSTLLSDEDLQEQISVVLRALD